MAKKKPEPARVPVLMLLKNETRDRLRLLAAQAKIRSVGKMVERLVEQAAGK